MIALRDSFISVKKIVEVAKRHSAERLRELGKKREREKAMVMHHGRFNFMREARIWYSRNPDQEALPGGLENEVILSDEFYREILDHPIPADLEAAKALSCSPAVLAEECHLDIGYREDALLRFGRTVTKRA